MGVNADPHIGRKEVMRPGSAQRFFYQSDSAYPIPPYPKLCKEEKR